VLATVLATSIGSVQDLYFGKIASFFTGITEYHSILESLYFIFILSIFLHLILLFLVDKRHVTIIT